MGPYQPASAAAKPLPTQTPAYGGSTPVPKPGQLGNAGFTYSQPTQAPQVPRAPLAQTQAANTYQQQPLASFQAQPPATDPMRYLEQGYTALKNDLRGGLEIGLRQVASDKTYSQEQSELARKAAQNAYSSSVGDVRDNIATSGAELGSARDVELSGRTRALEDYRSSIPLRENQYASEKAIDANRLKSLSASLGTLPSSQYFDAAIKAANTAQLAQAERAAKDANAEAQMQTDIGSRGGYFGEQISNLSRRGGELVRDLGNTFQEKLGGIASGAERMSRDALLAAQRAVSGYNTALADADINAGRDFAGQANTAANRALQEAQLTGMYNGEPTLAATESARLAERQRTLDRASFQDRFNDMKNADREYELDRMKVEQAGGKSAYTPQEISALRADISEATLRFLQDSNSGTPVDASQLEDYIYQVAPGTTPASIKIRQQLAQDANAYLQRQGWTGRRISPTPAGSPGKDTAAEMNLQAFLAAGTPAFKFDDKSTWTEEQKVLYTLIGQKEDPMARLITALINQPK